jgi:hypothetical protein
VNGAFQASFRPVHCACKLSGRFVNQQHLTGGLPEFEQGKKTFDNFIQLSFFLEDLFKRRVELVTTESLSPYIGPHIMSEVEYVILKILQNEGSS